MENKSLSLRKRIFIMTCTVILFQNITLFVAILTTGIFNQLKNESYEMLSEQVMTKAERTSGTFTDLSANTIKIVEVIEEGLNDIALTSGINPAEIYKNDEVFYEVNHYLMQEIEFTLRELNVTGAFFVFNKSNYQKNNPERNSVLYIRDTSPDKFINGNSALVMERGIKDIARENKIAFSTTWEIDFDFSQAVKEKNAEFHDQFYNLPLHMAQGLENVDTSVLGYWSNPFSLPNENKEIITYTIPLRYQGEVYGVFGIELSVSYLEKLFFTYNDLLFNDSFYVIGLADNESLKTDWLIYSSLQSQRYFNGIEGSLDLSKRVSRASVDLRKAYFSSKEAEVMYCSFYPLVIVDDTSPYNQNNWYLFGFVPENVLSHVSDNVFLFITIAAIITLLISIGLMVLITYFTTKQIRNVSILLKGMDMNYDIHFKKTNYTEIDELTSAIEELSENLVQSAKRISKIMDLTNMPIGCFEEIQNRDSVFVTASLLNILEIENKGKETFLKKDVWAGYYNQIINGKTEKDNTYLYKPHANCEKWLRIETDEFDSSSVGIIIDVTEEINEKRKLKEELDLDGLTKILNRNAFYKQVYKLIDSGSDKIGALIFSDLDNLKYINDTYGHEVGDKYIIAAAEMFNTFGTLGAVVARISGDEFAIYVHGFDSKEECRKKVFSFIHDNMNKTILTPDNKLQRIRCSMGIAYYPEDSTKMTELIKFADYAMYQGKNTIKGTVFEFDRSAYLKNYFILDKGEAINKLIDEELIQFAFQPIVDVKTGKVYAYEALLRSKMDEFQSPFEILSVAAVQSKLYQLERMTLHILGNWIHDNLKNLMDKKIFINVVANQYFYDEDYKEIKKLFLEIHPHAVFEITESEDSEMDFIQKKVEFIQNEMKGQIAIDDFGSGYSNQLRVLSLNPGYVKIDMGLVRDVHVDMDKQLLISNMIGYCRPKQIKVIAEGVESEAELNALVSLGVDYIQGYYFGRPEFVLKELDPQKVKQMLGESS